MPDETPPATLPLPASMTRCLAHDGRLGQACQKADQCARHLTIRHPAEPVTDPDLRTEYKVCADNSRQLFIAV